MDVEDFGTDSLIRQAIVVDAKVPWQNSDVALTEDVDVKVVAKGAWTGNATFEGWNGPEGQGPDNYYEVPWVAPYALMGRIGAEGRPFEVGEMKTFRALEEGYLYFAMNDPFGFLGDNLGSVTAHVYLRDRFAMGTAEPPRLNTRQQFALVIGLSRYELSSPNGPSDLAYADDDARAFCRVLERAGWDRDRIKVLIDGDASKRNVEIALESWLTKAGPDDTIVLFWSGHGYPDPEDPEKVYFACYDTDIRIPATGYRMDKVRAALEERNAKNVVIFADTCHAGKLITKGIGGISIIPHIEKMREEEDVPKGWIYMVAAETDRQAIEHSSWSNGAFTHCLIKALSGEADGYQSVGPKDGKVTLGEVRAYMNTVMPEETQKVLGSAKRPVILTSSGDPGIWDLTLQGK